MDKCEDQWDDESLLGKDVYRCEITHIAFWAVASPSRSQWNRSFEAARAMRGTGVTRGSSHPPLLGCSSYSACGSSVTSRR